MIDLFITGGKMMWPLLVIGIAILILAVRAAWSLRSGDIALVDAERRRHAILFWGVLSAVLGFLGTVIGIVMATRAIAMAGETEARLVLSGFGITLTTLIFGLVIFLVASVLWFALRQWHQKLVRSSAPNHA